MTETKLQAHVATPSRSLTDAVTSVSERWPAYGEKATVVGQLPAQISVAELGVVAEVGSEPWRLPVGVRESDLGPAYLEVYEGEHVIVAGAARSGKSTVLLALVESLRSGVEAGGAALSIWGVCGRRSPLSESGGLDKVVVGDDGASALLASARVHEGPLVLLVDDAEQFDDADQSFAGLLSARQRDLLVIAAGRSDDLRTLYSHWTKPLRKARCGLLLQPNIDYDGEILGTTLPRRAPVEITVGRGYLASGGALELVQTARPTVPVE